MSAWVSFSREDIILNCQPISMLCRDLCPGVRFAQNIFDLLEVKRKKWISVTIYFYSKKIESFEFIWLCECFKNVHFIILDIFIKAVIKVFDHHVMKRRVWFLFRLITCLTNNISFHVCFLLIFCFSSKETLISSCIKHVMIMMTCINRFWRCVKMTTKEIVRANFWIYFHCRFFTFMFQNSFYYGRKEISQFFCFISFVALSYILVWSVFRIKYNFSYSKPT